MLVYAIVAFVVGIIGYALHRAVPASRPLSTVAMYAGVGLGVLFLGIWLVVALTHGSAIEIEGMIR